MQAELSDLLCCRVEGCDGTLGRITDIYFDDVGWKIRYLAVTAEGGTSEPRQFLLALEALRNTVRQWGLISVILRQAEVYRRPPETAMRIISRQEEVRLRAFYGLPHYWPNPAVPENEPHTLKAVRAQLYRLGAVLGYRVCVGQDDIGCLIDLAVDDRTWEIQNLEVDASNWLPAGRIWVRSAGIQQVRASRHQIVLTMPRAAFVRRPIAGGLPVQDAPAELPLACAS